MNKYTLFSLLFIILEITPTISFIFTNNNFFYKNYLMKNNRLYNSNKLYNNRLCNIKMIIPHDNVITNIILSLYSRKYIKKLKYFSSQNNAFSKYNKTETIDYLLKSKYNIIFENFVTYDFQEIYMNKPTSKIYNVNLCLKNYKNLDLIFILVKEYKNKWRFENFYFNVI